MKKYLIVITGYSASGKTTFSKYLGEEKGVNIITFRNIVRELATVNEYKYIRDFYEYDKYAVDKTNNHVYRRIIDYYKNHNHIIYEGVISRETILQLQTNRVCDIFICFIALPYHIRVERIIERENIDADRAKSELKRKDGIKKIMGIDWLRYNADIILNSEEDISEMGKKFNEVLEERYGNVH